MQHFRKASEKLCITQPSLSHAISQLESELGVSLFDRQSRSSVLTKEGRQFLNYVQRSLSILDDGVSVMQKASKGEGIIKLWFLRTLGTSFVPEVAASFLETKPDKSIQFEFFSGITSSLLDGLKQDKYDVVFCTKIDQEVDIDFTPVEKQDLVLIVPRNHPLANHHSIDLSETLPIRRFIFPKVLDFVPSLTNSLKKSTESLPLPMKSRKTKLLPVWYPKDLALLLYPIWSSFCGWM